MTSQSHELHGFAEYPAICAQCQAEQAGVAADEQAERDERIRSNVAELNEAVTAAASAVAAIRVPLNALTADYDIELVEGSDADDLGHELDIAERALRNAARITERRAAKEG
jgi:hypothetical protein